MKLSDEIRIEAPREDVYAALNDAEILRRAIPGCEALERVSETEFTATVVARVGPVSAKFSGTARLSDLNPPEGYTIAGEGKGAAGFAKGQARVTLMADGEATVMRYEVEADVGGKLAQVGNRLIDGTSKKLAGEFFDAFKGIVAGEGVAPVPAAEAPPARAAATGIPPMVWAVGAAALAALVVLMWSL
ncbi:MAG: carbon monoxide dehydrogenase subunit G [Rhodospirillales bacterium]